MNSFIPGFYSRRSGGGKNDLRCNFRSLDIAIVAEIVPLCRQVPAYAGIVSPSVQDTQLFVRHAHNVRPNHLRARRQTVRRMRRIDVRGNIIDDVTGDPRINIDPGGGALIKVVHHPVGVIAANLSRTSAPASRGIKTE
jgi:hypothetical protein